MNKKNLGSDLAASRCKLIVDSQKQTADLWEGAERIAIYTISTAKNGLGCEVGSYCTPTGKLRVAQKIGDGAPLGRIFKARVDTNIDWPLGSHGGVGAHRSMVEQNDLQQATVQKIGDGFNFGMSANDDLVLTRILWLEGAEEKNSNTIYRHIYLHGTNQEHLLGQPVSHGCVRFSNKDIVDVFERLHVGDEVEIA